ncbi:hypothetical protein ColTof4_02894 [Colletotrichum tofieldiae]|nr:hypothetical protein ColTof3_08809 [Colletotrichum tofieldiae]GKT70471.1 hypothetical protein ColTof4_02894 [Colletotrichum tofieldiae]
MIVNDASQNWPEDGADNDDERSDGDHVGPFVGWDQLRVDNIDHGIYSRGTDALEGTEDDPDIDVSLRTDDGSRVALQLYH